MADANLNCKTCGKITEHMHLAGRECICSICGEKNMAKNWREIAAAVDERKRANQEAVASRNAVSSADLEQPGKQTLAMPNNSAANARKRLNEAEVAEIRKRYVELTAGGKSRWNAWVTLSADFGVSETSIRAKVSDMDKTNPAPARPIAAQPETPAADTETDETKKETNMRKRLTDQEKADIARRYQEGATVSTLSHDFGVTGQCIRTTLKRAKAHRGRKPGRVAKAPRPEAGAPQAGGLKAALQAMVDAAVEQAVQKRWDQMEEYFKVKVECALDIDKQLEAALARVLK